MTADTSSEQLTKYLTDVHSIEEQALAQMGLRRKINLLISEWKAAGGGDVLPDVGDRVRLRLVTTIGISARASTRR